MARVKCPCRRRVGYLRSLWMVYMQVGQPFQNSNVISSILEPINIHIFTHSDMLFTFLKIYLFFGVKSQRSYQVLVS